MDDNSFLDDRMRQLADVGVIKEDIEPEDELNYYLYEVLSSADMDCSNKKTGGGYTGIIRIVLKDNDFVGSEFSKGDILESLNYEKKMYVNYGGDNRFKIIIENRLVNIFLAILKP